MGDQQQKIEALRAAMTQIQERDPDEPVPDFLVVDTSVSAAETPAVPETGPAEAVPAGGTMLDAGPGAHPESDPESDPEADPEADPGSEPAGEAESDVPLDARPLVEPGPPPETTPPMAAEDDDPQIPAGVWDELSPEEQYEKARAVVLRRLTGSPKSRHQLAVALKEKEFSPSIIARVLDRMEEVHLVNDEEFARTWVKGRHELKNLGRSALRRELREKGISEPVAQDALEQISAEDEGAAARELVRRRLQGKAVPTGTGPEERAERDRVTRRLVSMLARRGHAPGAAFQIVREVLADHADA